jgi:hypothetical protein
VKEARVILGFDNAPSTLDLTIAFSEARVMPVRLLPTSATSFEAVAPP